MVPLNSERLLSPSSSSIHPFNKTSKIFWFRQRGQRTVDFVYLSWWSVESLDYIFQTLDFERGSWLCHQANSFEEESFQVELIIYQARSSTYTIVFHFVFYLRSVHPSWDSTGLIRQDGWSTALPFPGRRRGYWLQVLHSYPKWGKSLLLIRHIATRESFHVKDLNLQ